LPALAGKHGQPFGSVPTFCAQTCAIESAFSFSTFSDKMFVRTTGLFLLLLLLSTVLGISIR